MAVKKKQAPVRAARGRQTGLVQYAPRAPHIQEKLQRCMELAAGVENCDDISATELLQRLISVDEGIVNSLKAKFFEELFDALVMAEQRVAESEALIQALTLPKGRGHRRSPLPSMALRIWRGVKRAQWLAAVDGKTLSLNQATEVVLREIHAMDSKGNLLPKEQLESLVNSKLASALRAYRRVNAALRPDK